MILTIPFLCQVILAVGLTGYLSFRNGQKTIDQLATHLQQEIGDRIQQKLETYLETPHALNQLNADAIQMGLLNTANLEGLYRHFWQEVQTFDTLSSIYMGDRHGSVVGIGSLPDGTHTLIVTEQFPKLDVSRYALGADGDQGKLLDTLPNVDVRTRPWFQAAQTAGGPTWSPPYLDYETEELTISAVHPLYDAGGTLEYVLASDLYLRDLHEFLSGLSIGRSGEAFIIDRAGRLISTSTADPMMTVQGDTPFRLAATASPNAMVSQTAQQLLDTFGSFEAIKASEQRRWRLDKTRQFVNVMPFQDGYGLDWLVVTVIPESDFTQQIAANTRNTVALCMVATLVTVGLGVLTSYWIARPIRRMEAVSDAIARGNLKERIDETIPVRELQGLAQALNQMAQQLEIKEIAQRQQVAADLQLSEEKYRSLSENMTDGIYLLSETFQLVYCNPAMEDIFGRSPDFFKSNYTRSLLQCIDPRDRDLVRQAFFSSGNSSSLIQAGYRIVRPDGKLRYLRDVMHVVRDATGRVHRYQGIISDITTLRQAEEVLRRQARREMALNHVIQAIRQSLDIETVFQTATVETAALLRAEQVDVIKYLPEEQVWRSVLNSAPADPEAAHPGFEMADSNNPIATRLKQGGVVRIGDYGRWRDRLNLPTSSPEPRTWLLIPIWVNKAIWGGLSLRWEEPLQQWPDGEVDLACAVADQLAIAIQQSELYQQVRQLNSSLESQVRQRTAELQRTLHFESALKRITERIRDSLDEAHILQTAIDELADKLGIQFGNTILYHPGFPGDDYHLTVASEYTGTCPELSGLILDAAEFPEVEQTLLAGSQVQFCTQLLPRGGWQTILVCPMQDESDRLLGDILLIRHRQASFAEVEVGLIQQVANQCAIAIRQARLYQAAQMQVKELERLNRLKDDFLSTISHELRTPMSSIKMAAYMLEVNLKKQGVLTEEDDLLKRYFAILQDECQRETQLIDNLLDLSRLDAGTELLQISTVPLQTWVPHLAEVFQERCRRQQQTLYLDLPSDLPTIVTDETFLRRILIELLENACKYTPPYESVTLSASVSRSQFTLAITNTGVEIPPLERDRIFDKFYRIPSNDPWKHGGTGLGLALVKKLVQTLNGTITVQSGGDRTTFVVNFPITIEVPETQLSA
ncbi:MAG: ATP-binding protein [Synechococcales bacterium]|nr:ATP-binding protein [Synechococcales bacterium]